MSEAIENLSNKVDIETLHLRHFRYKKENLLKSITKKRDEILQLVESIEEDEKELKMVDYKMIEEQKWHIVIEVTERINPNISEEFYDREDIIQDIQDTVEDLGMYINNLEVKRINYFFQK